MRRLSAEAVMSVGFGGSNKEAGAGALHGVSMATLRRAL
jgi:hypothetical protein